MGSPEPAGAALALRFGWRSKFRPRDDTCGAASSNPAIEDRRRPLRWAYEPPLAGHPALRRFVLPDHVCSTKGAREPEATRLATLYAAAFLILGVSLPFLPVWLAAQHIAPDVIGFILALPIVVRILFSAPLLAVVDRGVPVRRLLIAAYLVSGAAYLSLPFAQGSIPVLALAIGIAALAQAPVIPASDLLTLAAVRRNARLDYGRVRLWGSLAFLAANVALGHLVGARGPGLVVWSLAALAVAGALAAFFAAPRPGQHATGEERVRRAKGPVRARFPRALMWLIASAACTQASHAAVYGFGSLVWAANGVSSAAIGWLWALGVAAEIGVFAALGRGVGPERSPTALLLLGSAAAVARFAGLAFQPGLVVTALLQALHGLSFGATHLGTMAALARLAPERGRGRAQGVLAASMAIASATAAVFSGVLYRSFGSFVFLGMVPLALAGFSIAACVRIGPRISPRGPGRVGE